MCFSISMIEAQSIKGKITDNNNEPLAGVNVIVKGTQKGDATNSSGLFFIKGLSKGKYILEVSIVGYEAKSISFLIKNQDKTIPPILLKPSKNRLKEVFVDGKLNKTRIPSKSLRLKSSIKATPQNIQIVDNSIIEKQQITNMLEGLTRNVSGVSMIEHWGHFARVNMRGFRLPAFRNGVNVQDKWGPLSEDMFMVDRVEFVKGPSGFMMAAGEPGGFYNVVTKKPTSEKIATLSLMAGTQDTYRGAADFGGKIGGSDRFLYRLNVMYQTASSHRKFEKANRFGFAPSLSFKITKNTTLLTEFNYQSADSYIGAAYVFAPVSAGYGSLNRNFTMIDSKYPKTNIKELSLLNRLTHNFNDNWSVEAQHVRMNYNQEGYSIWTYKITESGDASRSISPWDAVSEGDYFQLYINGKFNTGGLRHKILTGYDFTDKNYYAHGFYTSKPIDITPFNIYNPTYGNKVIPTFDKSIPIKNRAKVYQYGTKINSVYVQDEIGFLNDKIRLTLAGRYTKLDDKPSNKKEPENIEKITPRVGFSADIIPQVTIYGLYDQSFTPATGTPRPGISFKPIEGKIYEGGIKSDFLNNSLKASLSAYIITKNNVSVRDPKNKPKERFNVQLGEVQSKGFEFDLQGKITNELNVLFNYANTNVEVTKDPNPKNVGNKIPGHAKHITNGWVNYNFAKTSALKGFGLSLGYQYQIDRSSWRWKADNKTDLPDYFRLDGAITWRYNKVKVGLNINNLLNKYLYSGANYGSYLYWQSEPGTNGRLSISYSF